MRTYVTRIVVTQVDNYQPPAHDLTTAPGSQVWIVEWTQTAGPQPDYRSTQPSIAVARRLTMNLLKIRPPDLSVDEVLTLLGLDGQFEATGP